MARLVAVCRDGEEEFPFERRQIPLYIDDTLTMVMEFPDNVLNLDGHQNNGAQLKQFIQVIFFKLNVLNGVCVCFEESFKILALSISFLPGAL